MVFGTNDELRKSMADLGLDLSEYQDCVKFAGLLSNRKVAIPPSMACLENSRNGKCEWYIWKDFVNLYGHKINFESVSRLFEDPLPLNYEIIYEEYESQSTNMVRRDGSTDTRDNIVAKMDDNHYVVVKVDPEYTGSGKVRLITAFYADKAIVEDAKKKRMQSGDVDLFQSLIKINDVTYDYLEGVPEYKWDMSKFSLVYSYFRGGEYSNVDVANRLIEIDPSMSIKQADMIANSWMSKRATDHLLKLMRY